MALEPFAYFKLTGARFDAAKGFPADAGEILSRYQRLVLIMARVVYLDDHPNRSRVPGGFGDGLDLRVRGFEDGSSLPLLEREVTALHVPNQPIVMQDFYDRGRQALEDTLASLDRRTGVPFALSDDDLGEFQAFCKLLQDGEVAELGPPGASSARGTARREQVDELERLREGLRTIGRDVVRGQIVAMNTFKMTFTMRGVGRQVEGKYAIQQALAIRHRLRDEQTGRPWVALTGQVQRAANGAITELLSVDHIEYTADDAKEIVMAKLDLLRRLEDGWSGRGSRAVSEVALRNYGAFMESLGNHLDTRAEPTATPQGGLRLEWERYGDEFVVEIEPSGGVYMCILHADGRDEDVESSDFAASDLERFVRTGTLK